MVSSYNEVIKSLIGFGFSSNVTMIAASRIIIILNYRNNYPYKLSGAKKSNDESAFCAV